MILEGSYPYVFGGVSSWTHQYIQAMKKHEFVLWCIGAQSKDKDKFKYKLLTMWLEYIRYFWMMHCVWTVRAECTTKSERRRTACIADFNLRGKYGLEHFI